MPICPQCGAVGQELGGKCPRDGARMVREGALNRKDPNIGRVIDDRFVLVDFLGSGAMGTVYEGLQDRLRRRCAVKLLKEDLVANERLKKRFQREAELVARLNHPNTVTLFNYGIARDGASYMAMEFVEGKLLSKFQPYGFSEVDTLYIIAQLLDALTSAHRDQIIHRDLKPENIMVCNANALKPGDLPRVKVLDFGLAKLMEGREQTVLTMTGEVFGTPLYMSPEQAMNSSDSLRTSDVYSLGVILYELFTGRTPFDAPTPLGIMLQHVNTAVPEPKPRAGLTLSAPMRELLMRCLAKNPADRFEHAAKLMYAFLDTPEWLRVKAILEARKNAAHQRSADRLHAIDPQMLAQIESKFFVFDDDETVSLHLALKPKKQQEVAEDIVIPSSNLQPLSASEPIVYHSDDFIFEGVYGDPPPCFGRSSEVEIFKNILQNVREKQTPHLIHLTGPAGIGKTRILSAFQQHIHTADDFFVLLDIGRCSPKQSARPLDVFVQILRRRLGLKATSPEAEVLHNLRQLFRQYISQDPSRLSDQEIQLFGFLRYILDETKQQDPAQLLRYNVVLKWLRFYYERLLANDPIVMLIDDFHWASLPTQRLIDDLRGAFMDRPILCVLSGRHQPPSVLPPNTTHIEASPLPDQACDALIYKLLDRLPFVPTQVLAQIKSQSRGVPSAIEQTVRDLVSAGTITLLPDGTWGLQSHFSATTGLSAFEGHVAPGSHLGSEVDEDDYEDDDDVRTDTISDSISQLLTRSQSVHLPPSEDRSPTDQFISEDLRSLIETEAKIRAAAPPTPSEPTQRDAKRPTPPPLPPRRKS